MTKSNPAHSPAIAVGITARADDKIFRHELDEVIANVVQRKEMRSISDGLPAAPSASASF
jgi:hypothetical protein